MKYSIPKLLISEKGPSCGCLDGSAAGRGSVDTEVAPCATGNSNIDELIAALQELSCVSGVGNNVSIVRDTSGVGYGYPPGEQCQTGNGAS